MEIPDFFLFGARDFWRARFVLIIILIQEIFKGIK
jgi:hypothetical protein